MSQTADDQRGSGNRSALGRLISVDERTFADDYWGRKPLLSRASELQESFDDLMTPAAVDELISHRGVRTPFARMAKDGSLLDKSQFTASGGFGAEMTDQLDSAAILSAFADGHTLVLQGLHRLWPPLIDFVRDLVDDIGHPSQVNSYITPASSKGFSPHYDVHDVFVLQISGEKRWILHPPVHTHPLSNQPWSDRKNAVEERAIEAPHLDTVLQPGDALYLPRGWIHSAEALGDTTIHLTIGVSSFTRYDVAHNLLGVLQEDAELREPLPAGIDLTDADAVLPYVDRVVDDVANLLQQLKNDEPARRRIAERLGRRFADITRPEPVGPLRTVSFMNALDEDSAVVWRQGLTASISRSENKIHLGLRDKTVSLPDECADAIAQLQSGKPCRVSELVGLDSNSAIVVARRLLREGVLVPAP
ncbi:cupin domain-containing protein [Rhodococcoides kyotonense]|uniref:Ribosomal protein L16 Arg81 hydroxylase, contains JmjC domain n=1 Tax=Rhodococcoides kyotonense TaxID=398843 RepID=A0A239IVZ0_9NOCA|nr:cupin domain-containing protein [Rhodococcus kyotonensis]SNS97777.1 Ribosomal protein L16 Arg81 hydroxylase, contains JmjC domain [Rhodococcus kyotonensis]